MASDYELKDNRLGRMVAEATMALGAAAISMYLVSIPIDIIDRFPVKLPHDYVFLYSDGGVHANWLCEAICKKILPAKNKESVLDALAKIIKSAYSHALPGRDQHLLGGRKTGIPGLPIPGFHINAYVPPHHPLAVELPVAPSAPA
jgi:hypothetical protein